MRPSQKSKHRKNYTKLPQKNRSLALALIRTKTLQFFIGLFVIVGVLSAIGNVVIKTRVSAQPPVVVKPIVEKKVTPTFKPTFHVLKEGESLWDVAVQEYGNGEAYTKILNLNSFSDPDNVEPGTKLRIR